MDSRGGTPQVTGQQNPLPLLKKRVFYGLYELFLMEKVLWGRSMYCIILQSICLVPFIFFNILISKILVKVIYYMIYSVIVS
jgi:hypothetical protein